MIGHKGARNDRQTERAVTVDRGRISRGVIVAGDALAVAAMFALLAGFLVACEIVYQPACEGDCNGALGNDSYSREVLQ